MTVGVVAGEGGEDAGAEVCGDHELRDGKGPDVRPGEDWPVRSKEWGDSCPASFCEAAPRDQSDQHQNWGCHRQRGHVANTSHPAQTEQQQEDDHHRQGDQLRGLQGKHFLHTGSLLCQLAHPLQPRAGWPEQGEDVVESPGHPHHQGDVQHSPQDDGGVDSDAESGQERTQVVVEVSAGEGGVLTKEHLGQEERDTQHHHQQAVEQEEGGPAVPDDGHRKQEERMVRHTESRAGREESSGTWPWGLVNRNTGQQLLVWPT